MPLPPSSRLWRTDDTLITMPGVASCEAWAGMSAFCMLAAFLFTSAVSAKVIGLVPMRNEQPIIEQALRALTPYVDALIVLDDASIDDSVAIVKRLSTELPIVEIIENAHSFWEYARESDKRQLMLDRGRAHGGTQFVLLDADEIFSAVCMQGDILKNKLCALLPGQILYVPMIHVWKGLHQFRYDSSRWSPQHCIIGCAFGDDGRADYRDNPKDSHSGFIHMARIPKNLPDTVAPTFLMDLQYCIIHFRFANWHNVLVKRAWYMCLELIRAREVGGSGRTAADINYFYSYHEPFDDTNALFKTVDAAWYAYPAFNRDCFVENVTWRKDQVKQWFARYGKDFFKELAIWDIDWEE
ncbi:MAG: glycosyltransferase family 2 protein [Candidatus Babeliales bacterium]